MFMREKFKTYLFSQINLKYSITINLDVERKICINDINQVYGDSINFNARFEIDTCVLETNVTGAKRKDTGANQIMK